MGLINSLMVGNGWVSKDRVKLTLEDAREIRRLYFFERLAQQAIADRFGVCQPSISKIISNKQWKDPSA